MKFLDPMPEGTRKDVQQSIRDHLEVLREMLNTSADQARQYLTITNAGAAVAVMAFMGSSESARESRVAWVSLCCFVVGLIAAGVLAALEFHRRRSDLALWLIDSNEFFANKIDLAELYARLNTRNVKSGNRPIVAGYVAFGCFILGSLLSAGKFLASSIHPMQGPYRVEGSEPWCALVRGSKTLWCDYYSERHCEDPSNAMPDEVCVPRVE
jgi:hypothetical protein